jgi:hypothetical protein
MYALFYYFPCCLLILKGRVPAELSLCLHCLHRLAPVRAGAAAGPAEEQSRTEQTLPVLTPVRASPINYHGWGAVQSSQTTNKGYRISIEK